MGVKGLQTYMENYCPEACYRVSIKDLIETYRRETDREPVIVVDGSSCLRRLYGDLEWIQGGQLKEYVNICVSFVKAFESVGARLVFYFDGATIERKRPTWIERRVRSMKDVYKIFDILNFGQGAEAVSKYLFQLPPGVAASSRFIFKNVCGCEVRSSIRECDEEIAEYALRNRCFAILGQDTDYIIFEGAHYYLSIMRLDLRTMTTLNYNRWALARYLGIQPYQLPLLASLVGNDVVPADDLRNFHLWLLGKTGSFHSNSRLPFQLIIQSVAGYVRNLPSGPAMFQALPAVAHTVFYDERRARQLESSIRSYHVDVHAPSSHHVRSTSHWDMVLTKACELHVQCEIPNLLWSIMAGLPYEQSTGMEDFRVADLPPSATAMRALRQRIYGLLTHEKPRKDGDGVHPTIEEWCMSGPHSLQRPALVDAVPVPGHHPGLVALWTDRSEDMQDVRWKLFTAAVSPRLSSEQFRHLPSHLVVPAVSLFYLQNECLPPVAAMWEVDAIIAQAVLLSMYDAPTLSNIRTPTIDTRAVRLATLFQRATRIVFMLVATCGYPVPKLQIMPWQYFDGKLFHLTYLKAKSGAGHGELCNHQVVLLEQFQQVRRAVFG